MSEQALRVAQAAKSAAELQQYRQELHGEAKGRVNATHGKQPTLESVLPARYFAAATFCVCVLLAGWGLHQSDTYITVGSSLAYFLHQYGQHEQAVTNLMVEDLLKSLKADLARTAQPVDGTEPDDPADLSDDDYFIDITVQSCPYSDPEQDDDGPANDACYHAGLHFKDDLCDEDDPFYEDDLRYEDDLCYEDDTHCADDLCYQHDPYYADDGYYEDDSYCTDDSCPMKHLFTDGDNYCEGDLHDTDPFSELLAELMQPPAANTGQATPAAEGLDKYEFSFITKVILRLLIPLGCVMTMCQVVFVVLESVVRSHSEPHSYLGLLCWCRDFLDVMKAKRVNDLTLWLYIYKDEGLTAPVIIMAFIAMATNLPESCIGCRLGVSFAYNAANHYIGMKHLLMMCGLHRHYAVSPATFAALVAFQHACRCLPIQPRHTRGYLRFVEIAHLGLFLKLANDISNGCGLHFWAIALGFQHNSVSSTFWSAASFAVSPGAWWACTKHCTAFCCFEPGRAVLRLWHSDAIWACNYLLSVLGGLMTRIVISAQLSDPLMPLRLRANFGHKFEEGEVARSVALQQHWLLQRLYVYLWRFGAMRKYNVLLEQAEFQAAAALLNELNSKKITGCGVEYGGFSSLSLERLLEYFFVGMLGPWLQVLHLKPRIVRACFVIPLLVAVELPLLALVFAVRIYREWKQCCALGVTLLQFCLAVIVIAVSLVWDMISWLVSCVGGWVGVGLEYVAITLVAALQSRPLQRVWQLLQPLLGLVTAGMSWAVTSTWQALGCCTVLLGQWLWSWACILAPSQSRKRKAWEEEVAEVLAQCKGQKGKGTGRAKHQPKGKAAAPTKHQRHKRNTQPQAHPSDGDTSARQEATAQQQRHHVSTDAHEPASEAAANTPAVGSNQAAANPPVQASESVSKQATADKDSADTHKRRRQPSTKAAAKPATKSQMPKQAASQYTPEEVASAVHPSKKVLPPANGIVRDAVTAAPVPGGKPQAAQSVPQLQTPSPQLQQPAAGASQASASSKPSSANAPSATLSDPSTPLAPAPSQLQSALSLSPPSTPKASYLASDPLAFLLGQAPFSPRGNHANQPITKPAATITTSSALNVTQAADQATAPGVARAAPGVTKAAPGVAKAAPGVAKAAPGVAKAAAGVAKAAPVRVYSPPPVPLLPTFEESGKWREGGMGAAPDMGDDCIVCWAAKRSTLLAPCGHKALCRRCTLVLLANKETGRPCSCPICRKQVDSYIEREFEA